MVCVLQLAYSSGGAFAYTFDGTIGFQSFLHHKMCAVIFELHYHGMD